MAKREFFSSWWKGQVDHEAMRNFESAGFIPLGDLPRVRHWTAQAARAIFCFVKSHWKWTISTLIAIVAIIIQVSQ